MAVRLSCASEYKRNQSERTGFGRSATVRSPRREILVDTRPPPLGDAAQRREHYLTSQIGVTRTEQIKTGNRATGCRVKHHDSIPVCGRYSIQHLVNEIGLGVDEDAAVTGSQIVQDDHGP